MLKQIFRFCKPQNVEFIFRKPSLRTISVLNLNKETFSTFNLKSNFHTSTSTKSNRRLFVDHENSFAYNVILKDSLCSAKIKTPIKDVTSIEEFDATLDLNWRDSTVTEIVNTFLRIKNFCIMNNITVSDTRFDKLVDGLMDSCEHLTDEELINLLYCISELPLAESYSAHNFHDIWSCLDDICCWKLTEWDIDKSFVVANAWYKLHLGKLCDFVYTLIDRNVKRSEKLTKDQLVNFFFYFNLCRRRAVDFEFEFALEQLVKEMDVDEVAVIAMGYFKTKTKIKLIPIQEAIVKRVMENSSNIHEISLTAILKILRYSKPFNLIPLIEEMTVKLLPEIDRLSILSCIHLALLSTGIQTCNKMVLQRVSEKVVKDITDVDKVRVKDIERMLNVLTMFNYDPQTYPDIYKISFGEFHKNERLAEIIRYPRCLPCSLNYFSLRNMYSYELLDKILDAEYISSNFGKGAKALPREVFSLDCSIAIDCPDYKGNRLSPQLKYKAAKWLTDFTPTHDQYKKLTAADKLILDAIDTVRNIVGSENHMFIHHILPHFAKADIVVCKNKKTGKFVEPKGFENYVLGDIMVPFKDDTLEWFSIVILGWNATEKARNVPLGHSVMKERQLKKIGYTPLFVIWCEFQHLSSEQRKEYICSKLKLK